MAGDLVPAGPAGNDRLNELTNSFLTGRISGDTRRAYRLDLASWLRWCAAAGVHPTEAWPEHVMEWLAALAEAGESGGTRGRRLSCVSSWYKWLIRHRAMTRNPAILDRAERPKAAPRGAPALSDPQVEAMLDAAAADRNLRSAAIVFLLLTTGIRVGELIDANVGDLGMHRGVTVLHVMGKGRRQRPVEVEANTLDRINAYLASRTDITRLPALPDQPGAATRPLIATRSGRRIGRKEVRELLRRLARQAGLPASLVANLTPHSTRATSITAQLDAGVPLHVVQQQAGHGDPRTTLIYDRSRWDPNKSPARALAVRWRTGRRRTQPEGEAS